MHQHNPSGPRLPNEIFHAILAELPTDELLRLSTVNRSFYASAVIIVYKRVIQASTPPTRIELGCGFRRPGQGFSILQCHFDGVVPLGAHDFGSNPQSFRELRQAYSIYRIAHQRRPARAGDVSEVPFRLENDDVVIDTAGDTFTMEMGSSLASRSLKVSISLGAYDFEDKKPWLAQNVGEDHVGTILWFSPSRDTGIRVGVRRMEPTPPDQESNSTGVSTAKYTIVFKEFLARAATLWWKREKLIR